MGIIDWDFLEPGNPIDDVAQLAWYAVPLRGEEHCRLVRFDTMPDLRARLEALCKVCDAIPAAVLDALADLQAMEMRRTAELGQRGLPPWDSSLACGDRQEITAEAAWLAVHRDRLIG